jgi:ABC-2 type transport system ATP-binding protein
LKRGAKVTVSKLRKEYRVAERASGLSAALKALFHRTYKSVVAVDELSFQIEAGERIGFLGPNGAGKTTTLKMLAGLLHPTSGTIDVGGFVPSQRKAEFLDSVTLVLGQKQQLIWDLPPADTFELNRAIYRVEKADFEKRVGELVELLALTNIIRKPTRELSLGERMKCELVAALIHQPRVLFLDEPTIGLDVSMQVVLRDFVRQYNERYGATLLLTSHDMDDVMALCPRILVIDKGALIYDGTVTELVRQIRPEKRFAVRFTKPVNSSDLEAFGRIVKLEGEEAILALPQDEVPQRAQALLSQFPVLDFEVTRPPLEEVLSELFARGKSAVTVPGETSA